MAMTLSLVEWKLVRAFFDVMIHLILHVVEELNICGLVHSKWMYSIEWFIKIFKGYVRNKARLEASMAKGYVYDEMIGFVIKYMHEHVRSQIWDPDEEEGACNEVFEGVAAKFHLDHVA
jgi:hypothetical protein